MGQSHRGLLQVKDADGHQHQSLSWITPWGLEALHCSSSVSDASCFFWDWSLSVIQISTLSLTLQLETLSDAPEHSKVEFQPKNRSPAESRTLAGVWNFIF